MTKLDVLLVADPDLYAEAHVLMIGQAMVAPSWEDLCEWLALERVASCKAEHGAWTPALFIDNHKTKERLVHACALLIDVDEGGDVDRLAAVLVGHRALVHGTYSSTPEAPRARIVMPLVAPVDARADEHLWQVVVAHLGSRDVQVDLGTSDAGRLGYLPAHHPDRPAVRFVRVEGEALDADRILAAQPPIREPAAPKTVAPEHRDAYVRAAIRGCSEDLGSASVGDRHHTLLRAAWSLSRPDLGLSESEIESALLPVAVAVMGDRRRDEARRAVRDTYRARRRTS